MHGWLCLPGAENQPDRQTRSAQDELRDRLRGVSGTRAEVVEEGDSPSPSFSLGIQLDTEKSVYFLPYWVGSGRPGRAGRAGRVGSLLPGVPDVPVTPPTPPLATVTEQRLAE